MPILWNHIGLALAQWAQSCFVSPDQLFCREPLGCRWRPDASEFRVFAPSARQVRLHLYEASKGGRGRLLEMIPEPDGSWFLRLAGDHQMRSFTYSALHSGALSGVEVCDPYSVCVSGARGRSLILPPLPPLGPSAPRFSINQAVIYEVHVRDFTIDPASGHRQAGKFAGLAESGTRLRSDRRVKTGLDHVLELGANTLQLMPVQEFCSDERPGFNYGWGYDPAHYNSPDGWYASRPDGPARVHELRELVSTCHRRGLKVVLDVVYNHLDEELRAQHSSFEALAPGYYYRLDEQGRLSNGSGCGNEFRSEAPMARRFIKDSLRHWVEDYGVDGFRFDLLGLIDVRTVREAVQELRRDHPDVLIYGEPWAAGPTPISVTAKGSQRGLGFAVFNDHFRDALKGHVFRPHEGGFLQTGQFRSAVQRGLAGSVDDFADQPGETINYVECHDNHTLWDRLTLSAPDASRSQRIAMDRLAAALLLTSQGPVFLHSGQELLRSKGGEDNSYNLPDSVNRLDWSLKLENRAVFDYYRGLIALRKAHPLFALESAERIRRSLRFDESAPQGVIDATLSDLDGRDRWRTIRMVFNASRVSVPIELAAGSWQLCVNGERASALPFREVQGRLTVPPITAVIVAQPR